MEEEIKKNPAIGNNQNKLNNWKKNPIYVPPP